MLQSSRFVAAALALSLTACATARPLHTGRAPSDIEAWDRDGDGRVNRVELAIGVDRADLFDAWDLNDDRGLDRTEWYAGIGDAEADWGAWQTWDSDRDQQIWDDEFVDGLFLMWDGNGDGLIDAAELRAGLELL